MKNLYNIVYTENEHIWKIQRMVKKIGYTKTAECYWTQVFENGNGGTIVCIRDDVELYNDPCKRLAEMLGCAADDDNDD